MFLPCDHLLKEDHLQDASLHRYDRFQLPKKGDHRQCSQWRWARFFSLVDLQDFISDLGSRGRKNKIALKMTS